MKTFKIASYPNLEFTFYTNTYANNKNTYVGLYCIEDGGFPEPFSDLTVNLCIKLEKNQAFIDTNNNDESLIRYMMDNGFIKYLGIDCPSGFVLYPLFELNIEKINEYGGTI